jgi:crotonobetainyl-CoA:carnitine CoA-transferase CaiB-like acyl-CoA transferase
VNFSLLPPGGRPVAIANNREVGFPVIDTFSGHLAAFAIISALLRRERGGGQSIDVSRLDASMVLMSSMLLKFFGTGEAPKRVGNKGFSLSATADMFQIADRPISIGANTNRNRTQECQCGFTQSVHIMEAEPRCILTVMARSALTRIRLRAKVWTTYP